MKQTIKNGERVTFYSRGMENDFLDLLDLHISVNAFREKYNGKTCIAKLETYTEFSNREFEYYDITFDNGDTLKAVSGYYLDKILFKFNK